jgi:predicted NBD/HSP70 family sugar kinase
MNTTDALVVVIGGTTNRAGIIRPDNSSRPEFCWEAPSNRSYDGVIEDICTAFSKLDNGNVGAVVVGVPGRVDPRIHTTLLPPSFGSRRPMPLSADLSHELGLNVFVENDVNLMTLGEYRELKQSVESLTLIVVGTGVGAGSVLNSRIVRGRTGAAGEFGYLSASYQGRTWRIRELCAGGVFDKEKGPYASNEIINRLGAGVFEAIVSTIVIIDPDIIILSGGLMKAYGDAVIDYCRSEFSQCPSELLADSFSSVPIQLTALDHKAALLGAEEILEQHLSMPKMGPRGLGPGHGGWLRHGRPNARSHE